MDSFESDNGSVIINHEPGDDYLGEIQTACDTHDIDTGVVVSGVGSFTEIDIHWVVSYDGFPELTDVRPDRMERVHYEGAWEVGSLQGAIIDGSPHLHVTAYEAETDRMVAGHLEAGCTVHTLGEVVIQQLEGLELTRSPNDYDIGMIEERS